MTTGLLILAGFTVIYCMLAKRLSKTILTAPMIFLAFGYFLSTTGLLTHEEAEHSLHLVAEIALIILLFLDAAQIDLTVLRQHHQWPLRMLLIGLPLSMLIGAVAAAAFLPDWPLVAVALVAAILAPTDAALGQAVVTNHLVPDRVRRALTVESGLNDGLALPMVLLFASLTAQGSGDDRTNWLLFGVMQVTLGPLAGAVIGSLGGRLMLLASDKGLTAETYEGIGALALAACAYLGAEQIGGNGFIAAFVAGLAFGHITQGRCKFVFEFTESEGQILTWGAFFLMGLALLPNALHELTPAMLALILISLFVVRPLAIWLSLLGTDSKPMTRLFFGWFGPRGLATALFALLVVGNIDHEFAEPVLALAINAVWISALLHGISAVPAARWYARQVEKMGQCGEIQRITASAKPLITHKD